MSESAQPSDIDFILPITHVVSQMLAQAAYSQEIVGVSLKRDPDTSEYPLYSEFTVRFNGLRLSEVLKVAPVVMLEREGRLMLNPQPHTELKAGDTLYVFTERHSTLQELRALLAKRPLESRV